METWESARRAAKGNFEDELGTHMLIKLFELEPDAKNIFGFSKNEGVCLLPRGHLFKLLAQVVSFSFGDDRHSAFTSMILTQHFFFVSVCRTRARKPHYVDSQGWLLVFSQRSTNERKVWNEKRDPTALPGGRRRTTGTTDARNVEWPTLENMAEGHFSEILAQVGKRHKDFGVLGPDEFLKVHKAAWVEIYSVMSQEIVKSMD
eukprot:scaffold689_cov186-Amphora_coffeaeformis.AAC.10